MGLPPTVADATAESLGPVILSTARLLVIVTSVKTPGSPGTITLRQSTAVAVRSVTADGAIDDY